MDTILEEIPGPFYDPEAPFQMLVSDLGYSDYLGRLAIGKIFNGTARSRDTLVCIGKSGESSPLKVSKLQVYDGITLREMDAVGAGDIVVLSGVEAVEIGDTICNREAPRALKRISVDEPTISMKFTINDSPLGGRDGKYVQLNRIRERLLQETRRNVAIRLENGGDRDTLLVKGRGEFQLAILIETMRRESYEFSVGRPEVIYRYENNQRLEPIERLLIDCEERFLGVVT
jgi:GTP-binding protein